MLLGYMVLTIAPEYKDKINLDSYCGNIAEISTKLELMQSLQNKDELIKSYIDQSLYDFNRDCKEPTRYNNLEELDLNLCYNLYKIGLLNEIIKTEYPEMIPIITRSLSDSLFYYVKLSDGFIPSQAENLYMGVLDYLNKEEPKNSERKTAYTCYIIDFGGVTTTDIKEDESSESKIEMNRQIESPFYFTQTMFHEVNHQCMLDLPLGKRLDDENVSIIKETTADVFAKDLTILYLDHYIEKNIKSWYLNAAESVDSKIKNVGKRAEQVDVLLKEGKLEEAKALMEKTNKEYPELRKVNTAMLTLLRRYANDESITKEIVYINKEYKPNEAMHLIGLCTNLGDLSFIYYETTESKELKTKELEKKLITLTSNLKETIKLVNNSESEYYNHYADIWMDLAATEVYLNEVESRRDYNEKNVIKIIGNLREIYTNNKIPEIRGVDIKKNIKYIWDDNLDNNDFPKIMYPL